MNTLYRNAMGGMAFLALVGLSGCADMSPRDRDMAIGAGIGAAGGAVLTGGSPLGVVGGAAVGGVVGHEVGKSEERRRY